MEVVIRKDTVSNKTVIQYFKNEKLIQEATTEKDMQKVIDYYSGLKE